MLQNERIDRICPDCGISLSPRATYCGCGWGKKRISNSTPFDPQCVYENNGRRCKYPGSIALGTLGGGPWYCRIHIKDRGNLIGNQALDESQRYRNSSQPEDDLKDLTWLAGNFPMNPSETRQEYNLRCRDKALSALKGFRPKAVVNSEPVRMREPGEDFEEL